MRQKRVKKEEKITTLPELRKEMQDDILGINKKITINSLKTKTIKELFCLVHPLYREDYEMKANKLGVEL